MNKKLIYASALLPWFAFDLHAKSTSDVMASEPGSTWVLALSLGPVWENSGSTQTFYLQPGIEKTYVPNLTTSALFDGEIFLGVDRSFNSQWSGELGLAVAATSNAPLSGVIWDDANPAFDNYNYTYHVQDTRVMVKGKLIKDIDFQSLKVYASVGLGAGFNQASGYQSTAIIFQAIPAPNFTSNTTTAFAYTVGAGLQRVFNEHWQGGMGYEFADWGRSQLGRAPGQTMGTGLTLNHLYTNGMMFNLVYLA